MIQMKNKLRFYLILLLALLNCSDKIAGGSGAGNPGATTFAIVSVTTDSSEIPDTLTEGNSGIKMFPDTIRIDDDSSGLFIVNYAVLKINRIIFLFDSTGKKSPDRDSVHLPLISSDEGIIIEGPFLFNILGGISEPPLPGFSLPQGKYSGIRLEYDTLVPTMILHSSFQWNGRNLHLKVTEFFGGNDKFKKDANSFIINKNMKTTLKIVLNASKWLKGVSIVPLLNKGDLTIDRDDTLRLERSYPDTKSTSLADLIADNLRRSGKLFVNHTDISNDSQGE